MNYNYHLYYLNLFSIPLNCVYECVSVFCNFDGQSLCQFNQGSDDQFDWTLNKDSTPSVNTGPSKDISSAGQRFVLVFYKLLRAVVCFTLRSHSTQICFRSSSFDVFSKHFWHNFQRASFLWTRIPFEAFSFCDNFVPRGFLLYDKGDKIRDSPVTKVSLLPFFSTVRLRLKSICIAWTPSKIFKRYEKRC